MNHSFNNLLEKYLTDGKMRSTKTHQLIQHFRSAESLEEKLNISTAISVLTIAYMIDDSSLASKALAIAKQKKRN